MALASLLLFGGLLLITGFLTQLVALFLGVQMLVATLWKVKKGQSFAGGYEIDLILALLGFFLATTIGGPYSLEHYFRFWLL